MAANFIESLKVMGFGMIGIFSVTIVMIIIMHLLTKLFPSKPANHGDGSAIDKARS